MSQLLSGKQKGRFAAPPEARNERSPWSYVPIIVLLPVTIILVVMTAVPWTTYYNCQNSADFDNAVCVGARLRPVVEGTGSITGIVVVTGFLLVLSFVLSILAAVRMKAWPVWVCWAIAVLGCACVVVALLMLNGSLPTPMGELGPVPPPPPVGG